MLARPGPRIDAWALVRRLLSQRRRVCPPAPKPDRRRATSRPWPESTRVARPKDVARVHRESESRCRRSFAGRRDGGKCAQKCHLASGRMHVLDDVVGCAWRYGRKSPPFELAGSPCGAREEVRPLRFQVKCVLNALCSFIARSGHHASPLHAERPLGRYRFAPSSRARFGEQVSRADLRGCAWQSVGVRRIAPASAGTLVSPWFSADRACHARSLW